VCNTLFSANPIGAGKCAAHGTHHTSASPILSHITNNLGSNVIKTFLAESTMVSLSNKKNALPVYSRPHKLFVGIFIIQPIRLGGQSRFCPAQTEIEIERRLHKNKIHKKP
jgi:hypothetical protein